jgi:predicted nucleotidyltransferase
MSIAEFLLGQTRARVLAALLLHPEQRLHVRELARAIAASPGSLHRELRSLSDAGLLLRTEAGRQVYYQANADSPVFAELTGLLRKTAGAVDALRSALAPLDHAITLAFVYGSIASGTETPRSDIDVMILGEAGFAELALALNEVSTALGREVNPTPMSVAEFADKLRNGLGFAVNVAAGRKLWIKGNEHDFAELVEHRKTKGARRDRAGNQKSAGRD